jgi:hypothetical protein
VLVGAAAGGALIGAPTDAQGGADGGIEIVSRDGVAGGPWSDDGAGAGSPSIAADGSVVVFESTRAGLPAVSVRDRLTATTVTVPGTVTRNGAVSADGCVVAYVAADADAAPWQPTILDRCDGVVAEPAGTFASPLAAPAVSSDGSVVVWSTGESLLALERAVDAYEQAGEPTGLPVGAAVGPHVDASEDGSVVVLAASVQGVSQVYRWDRTLPDPVELVSATVEDDPANGDSTDPTVSGDGAVVAFETTATDLAGAAVTPAVVVRDADATVRVVAADAVRPDLSSEGRHLVFERDGAVLLATSADGPPFATVTESPVGVVADPLAVDPVEANAAVSADGSRIAFASDEGETLSTDSRFWTDAHVWLLDRAVLQVGALDLGDVTVGASADATTTITNAGPVEVAVGVPAATGPFTVGASTSAGVLAPAAVCDVTVRFAPVAAENAAGTLIVSDAFDPTRWASGELLGRGVAVATTVPVVSTTTPTTSVAPTTTSPRITPTTRPRPPATTPRRSTSTPTRTVTTPVGEARLAFSPALVVLDSVVAGTGRATSVVSLTNVGTAPATVIDVSLDASSGAGFEVDAATCIGTVLAPGSACQIAVEFTAAEVGTVAGLLAASAADGATATVELSATAVEPPALVVQPAVAAPGQVVTVTGSAFPAGEPLVLWWGRPDHHRRRRRRSVPRAARGDAPHARWTARGAHRRVARAVPPQRGVTARPLGAGPACVPGGARQRRQPRRRVTRRRSRATADLAG